MPPIILDFEVEELCGLVWSEKILQLAIATLRYLPPPVCGRKVRLIRVLTTLLVLGTWCR